MKTTSKSLLETERFVSRVLNQIKPSRGNSAAILALSGNLGSGKTAFTKILAKKLKITETVNSPTFVIMKKYLTHDSVFKTLIHIDAYRLDSPQELEKLGWLELLSNPKNLIVVEWAEKIVEILPDTALWICFEFVNENTRKLELRIKN
ncbi:MAG: tRNA (adenosine(37)-N6)-threonylcarbamoyltransferase complex ATPase subunit type 1 TsaE [Candidatus Zambryskibacteria bacterium RIFCSPHIGHO2_01_FULL_43_27]|uniref:tRNA threonylcarbamoyladenosine biosynthesis protein TsaE n=1 Tax=Candidatus Zambryskibacteria bacterium RIFCSPLOWO2_01_FULL_43_17 TaxID=1802760 RepID=A0A1G2U527_9BACT|nr:MAG: tRNA (adenosine(37)-N6)-threonylcarbamoyltransferase complex ATPase subunit type 1 TsaE [Candidatus Zambryskibacteria bacterium RIFCSPHIGHO2_01_FULL_43_27]OHB04597.1 MAG: tRNA (adenosine(37)-N6)-threonylcarbamoyltransferase complex ATPase subunit type 1 TsaE [Candidatus Zambryskibacteria bacterium RIFCSPLOWO2_01_FULL_43_17]